MNMRLILQSFDVMQCSCCYCVEMQNRWNKNSVTEMLFVLFLSFSSSLFLSFFLVS